MPVLKEYEQWLKKCMKFAEGIPQAAPCGSMTNERSRAAKSQALPRKRLGQFSLAPIASATPGCSDTSTTEPREELFFAGGFRKMEHLGRLIAHCDFMSGDDYLAVLSRRA